MHVTTGSSGGVKSGLGMLNSDQSLRGDMSTMICSNIYFFLELNEDLKFILFAVLLAAFMPIQIGFRRGQNYDVEEMDMESVESTLSLKRRGSCLRYLRFWFQRRLSRLKSIIVDILCEPWCTSSSSS